MTVNAIRRNEENSRLGVVIKSTVAGTAAGYAMKWLWPVHKQEDTLNRRAMINYCYKVTNKSKASEFEMLSKRTPAQDEFIKMTKLGYEEVEGKKAGSKHRVTVFSTKGIEDRVKNLGGEDSIDGKELRSIIREVNENSKRMLC